VAIGSSPAQEPLALAQNPPRRPPTHTSASEPWREFIQAQLALERNAMAIYQDSVDVHGPGDGYNSVKRFVAQLGAREPERSQPAAAAPNL